MKRILIITFVIFAYSYANAQWLANFEEAKLKSKTEEKLILLNFSGSDWCGPCMKLKREYFSSEEFSKFAMENLILVNADFPRGKSNRLSPEQQKHNDMLAEKFNNRGIFPFTILMDSNEKIIESWEGFPDESLAEFIAKIKSHFPKDDVKFGQQIFKKELLLMGSRFELVLVDDNEESAAKQIDLAINEIKRIENLISSWNADSETNIINENAGIKPVKVSKELFDLIERSKRISELTQGAFDITFGSIDKEIWHFDKNTKQLPNSSVAKQAVHLINYKNIICNNADTSIYLKNKGMKTGFGAIGKGYAAEKTKNILIANGIESGIINAGGDIIVWGSQPDGSPWTIGIANPNMKDLPFSWLEVSNSAVVTSGNYEKFIEIDGVKYSHIIDPRNGFPAHGLKSVTVICSNAELADALATSVFILGKDIGIDLINQMKGIECIVVDDNDHVLASTNINLSKKNLASN